ncbi:four-carbon acid sugar kinase family protein [Paenibacillus antri]|uniref:four-carbon acid sugar kinase family protein n=1 Tax=Paenibacillus antri TaxID=2582848 RepID=UPI0013050AAA|nr:four-carbon acid sugar kinase family protein [Paenibacillus antri]
MIGIVADDITGANDIGTMFAKAGYVTHVYPFEAFDPSAAAAAAERPDVVILDTASRLDAPGIAYGKVENATNRLKAAGARLWINKTCSVFRGNVGAEFDAMLDALGVSFAVVALGFPKNGRTTVDGMHYVRGLPLERSEFRNDPVHPMTTSSLVDILRGQTKRRVERLGERTAGLTPEGLRARLEEAESRGGYVILDVESQDDLRTIALAVRDDYVLCGSSALSEELALTLPGTRGSAQAKPLPLVEGVGILCAAGSLMPQTAGQIDYLKEKGVPIYEMDTLRLFSPQERAAELERLTDALVGVLRAGSHAAVHSTNDPVRVAETKRIGATLGMTGEQASRLVSDALADVASAVMARTGQNRLVTAGGETSASICDKLGVSGMRVWKEIEPGVPSCITLSEEPLMLVLKSGSFGKPSFLYDALQHLLEP